jgi:AcrR family transcriptional regulator
MRLLVTREDYYEAALAILGSEGAGRLKVTTLCKALKVTTGSFYGYFGSLDGFVDDFLAYWEDSQTKRIVLMANAPDDPAERIHLLKELGSTLPHAAEGAIRSWAHTNPKVADMQKKVDDRRLKALIQVLRPASASAQEARVLGTMAMTLLVGLQQWRQPVSKKDFNMLFNEFERIVRSRMSAVAADV